MKRKSIYDIESTEVGEPRKYPTIVSGNVAFILLCCLAHGR